MYQLHSKNKMEHDQVQVEGVHISSNTYNLNRKIWTEKKCGYPIF